MHRTPGRHPAASDIATKPAAQASEKAPRNRRRQYRMLGLWGAVTIVWDTLVATDILPFSRAASTVLLIGYIYLALILSNSKIRKHNSKRF